MSLTSYLAAPPRNKIMLLKKSGVNLTSNPQSEFQNSRHLPLLSPSSHPL